jgi:spore morphogenesis protein SipL
MMSCNCSKTCSKPVNQTSAGIVVCDSIGRINFLKDEKCIEPSIYIKGICPESELENKLEAGDNNWTEIFIPEILCIPPQKPDIEQIISVKVKTDIISQRVVQTPKFLLPTDENEEGTKLTGRKLIIEGVLRQTFIYTANRKEQSVHAAHFDIPFSVFIMIPGDTPLNRIFKIEPCIEDVFVCTLNDRQIFKNVTMFIKATPRTIC